MTDLSGRVLYHCICGCIWERDGLIFSKGGRKSRRNILICPDHPTIETGGIDHCTKHCMDCGKEFELSVFSVNKKYRCDSCQHEAEKERWRKKNHNHKKNTDEVESIPPIPKAKDKSDPDRWDCIHWSGKCLEIVFAEDLKHRPCKNCEEYKSTSIQDLLIAEHEWVAAH